MVITEKEYNTIQEEIYRKIQDGTTISRVEFLMSSRNLKEMMLKRSLPYDLDFFEFELCDDELRKIHISNKVNQNKDISTDKFEILNDDLRNFYLNSIIPNKKITIEYTQFIAGSDSQKIEYIIYRGLDHVDNSIKKWYEKWRKIMRRDIQIESILEP